MLNRNNYRTGNIIITERRSQIQLESDILIAWAEECKQQHTLIVKAPRYVGRQTAVKPKHRDRSGTGQDNQRDHIHTADKIITVAGGERGVEGGEKTARAIVRTRREKKQSHRPDQRKSWFLAQLWVLPLTHPPQPLVLEADKEREKERGGRVGETEREGALWIQDDTWQEVEQMHLQHLSQQHHIDKMLVTCISNLNPKPERQLKSF